MLAPFILGLEVATHEKVLGIFDVNGKSKGVSEQITPFKGLVSIGLALTVTVTACACPTQASAVVVGVIV